MVLDRYFRPRSTRDEGRRSSDLICTPLTARTVTRDYESLRRIWEIRYKMTGVRIIWEKVDTIHRLYKSVLCSQFVAMITCRTVFLLSNADVCRRKSLLSINRGVFNRLILKSLCLNSPPPPQSTAGNQCGQKRRVFDWSTAHIARFPKSAFNCGYSELFTE